MLFFKWGELPKALASDKSSRRLLLDWALETVLADFVDSRTARTGLLMRTVRHVAEVNVLALSPPGFECGRSVRTDPLKDFR